MKARKDGRELFEVFKETMQKPSLPAVKPQAVLREGPAREYGEPAYVVRLGDRGQIEVTLSNSWAYGLSIFLILLLAAAFVLGRRFAPVPEGAPQVDANQTIVGEGQRVGDVTRINAPTALLPESPVGVVPGDRGAVQPVAPVPAPVASRGGHFVCVATYVNPNARETKDKADEVVNFLKQRGFADVRSLVSKDGRHRVVAVGFFATATAVEAKETLSAVRSAEFRNRKFSDAYFQNVRDYQ